MYLEIDIFEYQYFWSYHPAQLQTNQHHPTISDQIIQFNSIHFYLYSAFNNKNCL